MVMFHGSTPVVVYSWSFEMVLGHVLSKMSLRYMTCFNLDSKVQGCWYVCQAAVQGETYNQSEGVNSPLCEH